MGSVAGWGADVQDQCDRSAYEGWEVQTLHQRGDGRHPHERDDRRHQYRGLVRGEEKRKVPEQNSESIREESQRAERVVLHREIHRGRSASGQDHP